MPYVSNYRSSGSLKSSFDVLTGPGAGNNSRMDTTTGIDAVYSFRTGKSAAVGGSGTVKPDPSSEVYKPPKGLVDALVYRKKFIERSVSSILTNNPVAPAHFLLGDMGHEFGTLKARYTCAPNTVYTDLSEFRTGVARNVRPEFWYELGEANYMVGNYPNISDDFNFFEGKGFPIFSSHTGPTMSALRGTASSHISEMNPFIPKASILSTLLELARGDIPGILTSLRRHLVTIQGLKASGVKDAGKALGSEYLNNVFGWTPIVKDIDRAMRLLLELDSLIFKSDSTRRSVRRVIRQRGDQFSTAGRLVVQHGFSANTTSNRDALWFNSFEENGIGLDTRLNTAQFDYSYTDTYSVNTTARFSVGLHPTPTNNGHLDRAIDLMGLELTPAVIWELTPWSWLIDWFLHIGTLIQNLSTLGLSNTILNYAYATGRVERFLSARGKPTLRSEGPGLITGFSGNFLWTWKIDTKVRIAASPFGFDVATGLLNANQLAILSALGLARSR